MKKISKNSIVAAVAILTIFSAIGSSGVRPAFAASPATVDLGTAGNFVILAKTGVSTTGTTSVVGDIGVSPAEATYITGFDLILPAASAFSTSALVTGKIHAPGYANPTPVTLTTAVLDMQTAYTDAMGRAPSVTELGAGNIGGLTLAPGVYKWGTGLAIPTDVTLSGNGNDIWIFQIAQNLNLSPAAKIVLTGGAKASNIFWVVAGQTTIGTTAVFNGNILDQTAIVLTTGAVLNGRALAQSAVTLDSNSVTLPAGGNSAAVPATPAIPATPAVPTVSPAVPATPAIPATPAVPTVSPAVPVISATPIACTQEAKKCSNGSSVGRVGSNCEFAKCPEINSAPITPATPPASAFGQQVRAIVANLYQGHKNSQVKTLQQFLISQNKGPAARALAKVGATTYFGALTRAALAEFQAKVKIKPALGNFGSITRAYLKAN